MNRFRRVLSRLAPLGVWLIVVPSIALTPMVVLPQPVSANADQATILAQEEGPAEVFPAVEEAEEELPWTNRYIAPTGMVLGGLVIALAVIGYALRVRGRYRVTK